MDMLYATIPMVGGNKRLYSEKRSAFVVNNKENLDSHQIHVVDTNLGSSIFFNAGSLCDPKITAQFESKEDEEYAKSQEYLEQKEEEEGI